MREQVCLTLVPALLSLFLLLGRHVQLRNESFCFTLYFIFSSLVSNERQTGSGSGGVGNGDELGGVREGETIIRIYCMRKESNFNKGLGETRFTDLNKTF